MAHGGHGKSREAAGGGSKGGLALHKSAEHKKIKIKRKMASIKNQMRSIQRLLKKNPSAEVKDAQQKLLEDLKKQSEQNQRAELERKMSLRYHKVKFFEKRKIERAIKRIEKLQEAGPHFSESVDMAQNLDATKQLEQLKEDLEYVRFFPKSEKYVSLFVGNDDNEVIAKRSILRKQIKANLAAAAATGVEPEEMVNDGDHVMEAIDDDFFLAGSSSDDAEANNQWCLTTLKPRVDHTASRTSDLKNHQEHQKRQNSSSRPQFRNRMPESTGRVFKNKAPQFCDETCQFQIRNNKSKRQKITTNPSPLDSPFPSYSEGQSASKPASSALSSKKHASPSNVPPSSRNSHVAKSLPIPEVDISNVDEPKKRRRKHRPKKKRT